MGEKIAYLGVDKSVPLEVLLSAATAAGDSLGEESPIELYAWVQPLASARRIRWFGLLVKMRSQLYPPSGNIAQSVEGIVDRLVFIRRESVVGTEQLEYFARAPGDTRLSRALCAIGQEGVVRAVVGKLQGATGDDDDPIRLALAQLFPGEEEAYWDAFDDCEVFQLMRDGRACAPVKMDESALHGCRNYLPHWADEDDLEAAFPDHDDAPPPESGRMEQGQRPGIPTTWPELIERTASQMPRMEAKLGEEPVLLEAASLIAARAIAIEPRAVVPWVGVVWPRLAATVNGSREGFEPADALGVMHCVFVSRSCGAQVDPQVEAYAKHMIEVTAEHAASLSDRGRRKLAIAALGVGAFESVGRCLGVNLEARVEPGKLHSFGIESSLAYLAAGLRAKQPARDLEPAYREIVTGFPYQLHLEKLDWADLFAIARAFQVFGLGAPAGQVGARLFGEVRGHASAPPVTWAELGPRLREGAVEMLGAARALKTRVQSLPANALAGEVVGEAAELFAKMATIDPGLGLTHTKDFAGAMGRSMGEVPEKESLATSRAVFGTFAYLVASTACGAPSPDFTRIERVWLGDLAKTHMSEKLPDDLFRSLLYASLGAGLPKLVLLLLGDPKPSARRGSAPQNDPIAIAQHLAEALDQEWSIEEAIPAFVAFYQRFPDAQARGEATFFDLLSIVRAHHVQLRKQPVRGFGTFLRDLVLALSPPPPKPVVREVPMPQASGPRPTRNAPLPRAAWSRVELRDIEGLWGGYVVTVFGDGDFWFELVDRTKVSRLYRATLHPSGMSDLGAVLARHDPRAMRVPMRNGVPGESCPTLSVIGEGFTHRVSKWANDKHPDFDAVASWLRATGDNLAKATAPVWTGPFDWHWSPG
ncbi:MAG: hypothetical protein ACXVEE_30405 [Polyangiales bacterium]